MTELMARQETNLKLIEKAKSVRMMLAQRNEQLAGIPARLDDARAKLLLDKKAIENAVESARIVYENAIAKSKIDMDNAEKAYNVTVAEINAEKSDWETRKANAEQWLVKYEANNPENTDVPALLQQAETHNKKYNIVCQYREKKSQFDKIKAASENMDAKIAELADERAELIANAKLPIDGLTFTDDGLELNGDPFVPGKVSDSQTMEIAAKLVIASNPTVKVFRIARGESLGAKRLQTIVDIARKNGFQGFIEQVQRGQNEMLVEEYTEA